MLVLNFHSVYSMQLTKLASLSQLHENCVHATVTFLSSGMLQRPTKQHGYVEIDDCQGMTRQSVVELVLVPQSMS